MDTENKYGRGIISFCYNIKDLIQSNYQSFLCEHARSYSLTIVLRTLSYFSCNIDETALTLTENFL